MESREEGWVGDCRIAHVKKSAVGMRLKGHGNVASCRQLIVNTQVK